SNLSLAAVNGRIREAIWTLPADRFATGRSAPEPVGRRAFRDGHIITGNLPIVPTREMLTVTNRPANAASMLSSGLQESYFTKRQPAAPQSFEKEAALVQASIGGTGQLVPVREVTRLDSSNPALQNIELENGTERTVEPKKENPQSEQKSRSQLQAGLRAAAPPRMLR